LLYISGAERLKKKKERKKEEEEKKDGKPSR